MNKRLMTLPEFTGIYGVSRASIYREVKSGRLRFVKVGKRSLIDADDAESWLAALPRTA
jgi:excisionase family DNA binding protein